MCRASNVVQEKKNTLFAKVHLSAISTSSPPAGGTSSPTSSASAAARMVAIFSRMTLIASGSSRSGAYGPSDSTLTDRAKAKTRQARSRSPYDSSKMERRCDLQINQSRILFSSTHPANSSCRRTSRETLSLRMPRSSIETCDVSFSNSGSPCTLSLELPRC
jgi:hypothetical protein